MKQMLQQFAEQPTRENYLAVLQRLREVGEPSVTPAEIAALSAQLAVANDSAALSAIQRLPKSAAFSPRVHYLAAEFCDRVGDQRRAELERFLFSACLTGLLATGDGTLARPYVVCQVSDERDILLALGEISAELKVLTRGQRTLDRHRCESGREICFDCSQALLSPVLVAAPEAAEPPVALVRLAPAEAAVTRKRRPGGGRLKAARPAPGIAASRRARPAGR